MSSVSRIPFHLVLIGGLCGMPLALAAQTVNDANIPVEPDYSFLSAMPRQDMQNVQPAEHVLLATIQKLDADRQAGKADDVLADELDVIDARQVVIEAQITADQTRMPQAPPDVQAALQARDQLLRAEEALGTAQRKLISDQQAKASEQVGQDLRAVQSARDQAQKARQRWRLSRAQFRAIEPPIDSR